MDHIIWLYINGSKSAPCFIKAYIIHKKWVHSKDFVFSIGNFTWRKSKMICAIIFLYTIRYFNLPRTDSGYVVIRSNCDVSKTTKSSGINFHIVCQITSTDNGSGDRSIDGDVWIRADRSWVVALKFDWVWAKAEKWITKKFQKFESK